MRASRTQFEIFSLSAIDLFASAMGAFVIITAMLMPYYPNMADKGEMLENLQKKIEESAAAEQEAIKKMQAIEDEIVKRDAALAASRRQSGEKRQLDRMIAENDAASSVLEQKIGPLITRLAELRQKEKAAKPVGGSPGDVDFSVLGITTNKKAILVVIDLSGSMSSWSSTLVDTLLRIIEPFHEEIDFGMIGYQGSAVTQYWPQPLRLARGTAGSKQEAERFIRQLPGIVNGTTPTKAAMLRALQYPGIDAIILVSDGDPTDSTPDEVIELVTRLNTRKIQINTVAVGDYLSDTNSRLVRFLNDIAKRNGGQFVGVMN